MYKEVVNVQRHCQEGDLVTVEAHPVGACEVTVFSGAVCCAGANNGGLLLPAACASVFLLALFAWCLQGDKKMIRQFPTNTGIGFLCNIMRFQPRGRTR